MSLTDATYWLEKGNAADPVGHEGRVVLMVASSDNKWIATAAEDGTIIVWDTESGTIVQEWLPYQGCNVRDLAFSPDSPRLASVSADGRGSDDRLLVVWHIGADGVRKAATPAGHTRTVTECAWSPDGTLLASASKGGMICVWDALTFEQRGVANEFDAVSGVPASRRPSLQFSPDSRYITWAAQCRIFGTYVWRPLTSERPRWLTSLGSTDGSRKFPIDTLSFDPEGRRIAIVTWDPWAVQIWPWDSVRNMPLVLLAGHTEPVADVSFSPDGRSILSASLDGLVKLWDAESGVETAPLLVYERYTTSPAPVVKACYSPNGKHIATIAMGLSTVQLWRTDNASCAVEFIEHNGAEVSQVVFSPNGRFLASGDVNGLVVIRRFPDSLRY